MYILYLLNLLQSIFKYYYSSARLHIASPSLCAIVVIHFISTYVIIYIISCAYFCCKQFILFKEKLKITPTKKAFKLTHMHTTLGSDGKL